MSAKTGIEWCDSTVNPITGCDGCELWAELLAAGRLGGPCYAGNYQEQRLARIWPGLYSSTFTEVRLSFAVGRVGLYWVGYAITEPGFFLFNLAAGHLLGVFDRDDAIRRVGAIAQDPAEAYGGIEEWFVEEALRGDPEAYRCPRCQEVCCGVDHAADDETAYWEDFRL